MTNYAKQQIIKLDCRMKFPFLIHITYRDENNQETELYYANSDNNITYDGHTYLASWFNITPSEKTATGFSDAKITISSIDQTWISRIRTTSKKATIEFVAIIQHTEEGTEYIEEMERQTFTLTNANWNRTTIDWVMKFDELMNLQVCDVIDGNICPALA